MSKLFNSKLNGKQILTISVIAIILVVFGAVFHTQHEQITGYRQQTHAELVASRSAKKDRKNYTINNLVKHYDETQPNILAIQQKKSKAITKGLNLAFSQSQTSAKFNRNKPMISKLLGSSFSQPVLSLVKPQVSNSFNKPRSSADKMTGLKLAFGRYSTSAYILPFNIIVKYDTPPTDNQAGAGAHVSHKPTINHYTAIYSGFLNVHNGALTVNRYYDPSNTSNN